MARPRRIDRDAVLAASLEVADELGVDRLTMQAVSDRLGVTAMALYRHVDDKADLLDGVVERLLDEIRPPDPATPPREQLAAIGREVRRLARSHPSVFPLLLQRPASTPAALRSRNRLVELLDDMGVPAADVARAERVISTIVLGFAASEAGGRFARHARRDVDADYALVEATIADLIDRLAAGR